jgi:hypothetical protein
VGEVVAVIVVTATLAALEGGDSAVVGAAVVAVDVVDVVDAVVVGADVVVPAGCVVVDVTSSVEVVVVVVGPGTVAPAARSGATAAIADAPHSSTALPRRPKTATSFDLLPRPNVNEVDATGQQITPAVAGVQRRIVDGRH